MKVLIDDKKNPGCRKTVEVKVLEDRGTTLKVQLPDGNIITRKKNRDLPKEVA